MFTKTMMMAAFALTTAGAMTATAQTSMPTPSGSQTDTMGTTGTQTGTMSGNGTMSGSGMSTGMDGMSTTMPMMTKSQTASWKKCQAMPEAKMMKNKTCMKMSKMQGASTGAM